MKVALLFLAMVSLAIAPLAPANPVASPVAAAETCAMPCCHEQAPAAEKDCAPSCRCPVSCVAPAHTTAVMPIAAGVSPPQFRPAMPGRVSDESAPERNVRPPVPPPRA